MKTIKGCFAISLILLLPATRSCPWYWHSLRMLQVFFLQAGCYRFCWSVYLGALFGCSSWTYRAKNIIGTLLHLYLFLGKIQSEDKINVNYLTSYSTITALLWGTVICNLYFLFLRTSVFFFCFVLFSFFCTIFALTFGVSKSQTR